MGSSGCIEKAHVDEEESAQSNDTSTSTEQGFEEDAEGMGPGSDDDKWVIPESTSSVELHYRSTSDPYFARALPFFEFLVAKVRAQFPRRDGQLHRVEMVAGESVLVCGDCGEYVSLAAPYDTEDAPPPACFAEYYSCRAFHEHQAFDHDTLPGACGDGCFECEQLMCPISLPLEHFSSLSEEAHVLRRVADGTRVVSVIAAGAGTYNYQCTQCRAEWPAEACSALDSYIQHSCPTDSLQAAPDLPISERLVLEYNVARGTTIAGKLLV